MEGEIAAFPFVFIGQCEGTLQHVVYSTASPATSGGESKVHPPVGGVGGTIYGRVNHVTCSTVVPSLGLKTVKRKPIRKVT